MTEQSKNKITAVIFDVGGVLTDYHAYEYYLGLGYPEETAERLRLATMASDDWKEYDRGVLTDEEVRARFKKNDPELADKIDQSLTHMYGLVTRRTAAIPWIESVKARGVKTFVLSNFSYTCLEDCREALDFESHLDGVFWSCREKVIKPDTAAFIMCLYKFGLDPAKTVFIDDTQMNIEAAAKVGLRTILYKDQQQAERELGDMMDAE